MFDQSIFIFFFSGLNVNLGIWAKFSARSALETLQRRIAHKPVDKSRLAIIKIMRSSVDSEIVVVLAGQRFVADIAHPGELRALP